MAKQQREVVEWGAIDVTKMPKAYQSAFADYRKAQEEANAKRSACEKIATAHFTANKTVPDGMEPVYHYRFGEPRMGFAPPRERRASGKRYA